ncbi:hypothetical protein T484DRAFT_1611111, partial [Baffinella frigidus]
TLHPAPCTLHPEPCTLHPAPCTLHPAPCTLHPAPCTLHPAPCTQHPDWGKAHLTVTIIRGLRLCEVARGGDLPPKFIKSSLDVWPFSSARASNSRLSPGKGICSSVGLIEFGGWSPAAR